MIFDRLASTRFKFSKRRAAVELPAVPPGDGRRVTASALTVLPHAQGREEAATIRKSSSPGAGSMTTWRVTLPAMSSLMLRNGIDVARAARSACWASRSWKTARTSATAGGRPRSGTSELGSPVVVSDPWADSDEVAHEYGVRLGTIDAAHPVMH